MANPLSSKLRAPFQRAHDAVLQSFATIDPTTTIVEALHVKWGIHRDRQGNLVPCDGTPSSPSFDLYLKPSTSHHHKIQTIARMQSLSALWEKVHAPLLTMIVDSLPLLQGPESMGDLVWFHPRNHDDRGDHCWALLELNHQTVHHKALHVPRTTKDLLLCLDRVVERAQMCAPATHHHIITAPSHATGRYVQSTVSAATTAEARIFLAAMDPEHWDQRTHTLAFRTTP